MTPVPLFTLVASAAPSRGVLRLALGGAGQWEEVWREYARDPWRLYELASAYGLWLCAAVLAVAAAVASARSAVWRWQHLRHQAEAQVVEIAVPVAVEEGSAAAWWAHLTGLLAPAWKRVLLRQPHLAWELLADEDGVHFQVWVPGTISVSLIEKTIRSAWPGAILTTRPATPPVPVEAASAGGRLVLSRADHYPLKTDHEADPLRAVLGAVEGLAPGEYAAVQILARPITGRRLGRAHRAAAALRGGRSAAPQAAVFDFLTPGARRGSMTGYAQPGELARMFPERAQQVQAILGKAAQPRFEAQITYLVATTRHLLPTAGPTAGTGTGVGEEATQRAAARGWLRGGAHQLAAAFALYASGHQYLRRRRLRRAATQLAARRLGRSYLLAAGELAALAHLPYDLAAPGVTRAGARPVAPSPGVPAAGRGVRVLGDAQARQSRPVGLSVADARQHLHVIGQTGVGKSTFLAHQILADARAGRGALVIDPKGDLITDVLDRLPEAAIGRTVVFDPAEDGPPPSLNVLAGNDSSFAAEAIVTTFRRAFSSGWGPRMDDLMRSACLTLVAVQGARATLADLPRLLADDDFRTATVAKLKDPLLRGFWDSYNELSPGGRASVVAPVMNKLRAVLLRPFVRDALSGAASTVDLRHLLNTGGLVLARLPKGMLGEDATRLAGSLILAHTWQAITPRARQPEHQRRDASAYVDEAHNFLNLPGGVSDLLAEARGYRFSLVLAHQHLSQLPPDLREALSADARNKIYFTVSPEDATALARHVGPVLTGYDLAHLGGFQAAARIVNDRKPAPPFTFTTRPLPDPIPGRAEQVRAASRREYAAQVDPAGGGWAFGMDATHKFGVSRASTPDTSAGSDAPACADKPHTSSFGGEMPGWPE